MVFRKLHNEESYDLYPENTGDIVSRNLSWMGIMAGMRENISVHTYCAEKIPFGRPGSAWENNVEINL